MHALDTEAAAFEAARLPATEVSSHPVSARLSSYHRRDLLSAHARRLRSLATSGKVDPRVATVASEYAKRQLKHREAKAHADAEEATAEAKGPRPASAPGFFHHVPSTTAEQEMSDVYLEKRRAEMVARRNRKEVEAAVREWQLARTRAEQEITRRIESRRRPLSAASSGSLRVQHTVADTFTPPPPVSARAAAAATSAPSSQSNGAPVRRKPRPKSAGAAATAASRRRLAVPVAVPRMGMRYKNSRPQSAVTRRRPGGSGVSVAAAQPPMPAAAHAPAGVSKVEASASRLRNLAWGDADDVAAVPGRVAAVRPARGIASAAAGARSSHPVLPRHGYGAEPAVVGEEEAAPPSERRHAQLDEAARVQAAFAKANIAIDPAKLRRALVMTDDKPAHVVSAAHATPGLCLPHNPLAKELATLERLRRKAKVGLKKKKKGAGKTRVKKKAVSAR